MGPIKFANRRFGLGTLNMVFSGLNKHSIALSPPLIFGCYARLGYIARRTGDG